MTPMQRAMQALDQSLPADRIIEGPTDQAVAVRAVLEALRNPTPETVASVLPRIQSPTTEQQSIGAAAVRLLGEEQPVAFVVAGEMVREWQAMIDAGLAEGE